MRSAGSHLRLSPTDLANHLGCHHLTTLNRRHALGELELPHYHDPTIEVLRERGIQHENSYIDSLRAAGADIERISDGDDGTATLDAMRRGVDVIVQATLTVGRFLGRADVLRKVETPSELGDFSYEALDTKLAQETKGGTILQLCLYSDLLTQLQGVAPECMYVVTPPDGDGSGVERYRVERYRVAEFGAFYRQVRERLERFVDREEPAATYPSPVPQCDVCRWWPSCDSQRRADDHPSFVAGLGRLHEQELVLQGVRTLTAFAERATPLDVPPKRGTVETYEKLHAQARIQLAGRQSGDPEHELLPFERELGVARLPEPSPGDVFFDIEGDAYVEGGGLEYLLGVAFADGGSELEYRAWYGLDREHEKQAFEAFVDFVMARWEADPGMHIYHYHVYEPAAVKRLMTRFAAREEDVDRLLRAGRFIDLYSIAKQTVRASVERYSLKDLEPFFGFERDVDLREASHARRAVECSLELGAEVDPDLLAKVEGYNRDDCVATEGLRRWLEELRRQHERLGVDVGRPPAVPGDASEELSEWLAGLRVLFERLVDGVPADDRDRSDSHDARWLLAHLLEYFRRESKCAFWELVRLREMDDDDLFAERDAVVGLELIDTVGGTDRCPVHRYRYPAQETAIDEGDELRRPRPEDDDEAAIGTVVAIDRAARTLDVKKRSKLASVHSRSMFRYSDIPTFKLNDALHEIARWVADQGVDGDGPYRAARDLLLRRPPRRAAGMGEVLQRDGDDVAAIARRLVLELDEGVLPIQGPPGTGKTYTGARMILDLVRAGKTVGITAVSHKVIRNLLDNVREAAEEEVVDVQCVHKISARGEIADPPAAWLHETKANDEALAGLLPGQVVGGTAWLWARDDAAQSVDYLFVDEAGQMSLAMVLAASRAARNLVLLGDPQQLEQPQQAAHPEGSDVAALVHVLDGGETMPPDRGLFLDRTYRMSAPICEFTSELYYERRLVHHASCDEQAILGDSEFAGTGLYLVPVAHEGNQSQSLEEVDAVARVVARLRGATWRNRKGEVAPLDLHEDVLIVAPYNAQLSVLQERLPGMKIGTVDKFQGQQAAIVIYSMTTSTPEDAPRGMGFLYSPNRFNVATSRARCAVVLVANERLFEPECRTPAQMRWANGLCRYRELAVTLPGGGPET